jgi:hypothetical protein
MFHARALPQEFLMNHDPTTVADARPVHRPAPVVTHPPHRPVLRQIKDCHTQIERAVWMANRAVSARSVSVFDPEIRRFFVHWVPTIGNVLVRYDGPADGHATRQSAIEEGNRLREQALRFAQGDPGAPVRQDAVTAPLNAALAQLSELLVETLEYLPERRSVGYEPDFGPVTVPNGTAVLELRRRIVEKLDVLRTGVTTRPAAAIDG